VTALFSSYPSLQGLVDKGLLRVLAATAPSQSPATKALPLMSASLPGYEYTTWYAMYAPLATPTPLVQRIQQALAHALALEAVQQVDALDFQVVRARVGHGQAGGTEHQVAHGRAARRRFGQPQAHGRQRQPVAVQLHVVLALAVGDDVGAVEDARKRFQEGGLPHQRQRLLVALHARPDGDEHAGFFIHVACHALLLM